MFFQNAPAMTTNYMIAGYAVLFTGLLIYVLSLVVRTNQLKQDLQVLEEDKDTPGA